jgi:hypothetical protein
MMYWLSTAVLAFAPLGLALKIVPAGFFDGPRGD